MSMSEYYNLPDFDPTFLTDAKIKHYITVIQQNYIHTGNMLFGILRN